ncbi:MAG: ParB N-terminal domain-containing protein [Boseongicola sp.]|nr:ParB N-terminal domain-containing protein [Boseongicola sp.]
MEDDDNSIAIMGETVEAVRQRIPIDELLFLPDNPRVYAAIREMSDFCDLTQEERQVRIYERMLEEQSVKNLIPEIKRDNGLQEPIIVRWDTRQVIEGNSRLAAFRKLRDEFPEEEPWAEINCLVVSKLTEEQQTRLLGQAHLHGKTDWSPYAKALYCFRWVEELGKDISELVRVSGITRAEIGKSVKVIKLMQENCDDTLSNFSYYDVLVRSKKIAAAIDDSRQLRDIVLSAIKDKNRNFTGQEMRQRLPIIIDKPRILRKFAQGHVTLEEAYDRAKISGLQKKLKNVRDGLDDIERADTINLEQNELRAAEQFIRKIGREVKRVSTMIEQELTSRSEAK